MLQNNQKRCHSFHSPYANHILFEISIEWKRNTHSGPDGVRFNLYEEKDNVNLTWIYTIKGIISIKEYFCIMLMPLVYFFFPFFFNMEINIQYMLCIMYLHKKSWVSKMEKRLKGCTITIYYVFIDSHMYVFFGYTYASVLPLWFKIKACYRGALENFDARPTKKKKEENLNQPILCRYVIHITVR